MKNLIALTTLCFVIAQSVVCKKTKATVDSKGVPEVPVVYPDCAMLKKGNYWIYGRFQVEQNGTTTDLKQSDSCYINKDTIVRATLF